MNAAGFIDRHTSRAGRCAVVIRSVRQALIFSAQRFYRAKYDEQRHKEKKAPESHPHAFQASMF
jgi:hypothetical protein